MKKLRNGAKVLAYCPIVDGNVVLCEWGKQFVTWVTDDSGSAFLGHYFGKYRDAVHDFMGRVKSYTKED